MREPALSPPPLYTIGYERAALADLIATLKSHQVTRVIDVREVAWSRRREFAKAALWSALGAAGLGYGHARQLGTPKAGRDAARAADRDGFRRIFDNHLALPEAQAELAAAAERAGSETVCLLCYERDPAHCHRTIVADAIATRTGQAVVALMVGAPGEVTAQGELFGD